MYKKHRSTNSMPIIGRSIEGGGRCRPTKLPGTQPAEEMKEGELKRHLCAYGPTGCGSCRLCAYGREWKRREEEHGKQE